MRPTEKKESRENDREIWEKDIFEEEFVSSSRLVRISSLLNFPARALSTHFLGFRLRHLSFFRTLNDRGKKKDEA